MNLLPFLLGIRKVNKMTLLRKDKKFVDIGRWCLENRQFGLPTGQDGRIKAIKQKGE